MDCCTPCFYDCLGLVLTYSSSPIREGVLTLPSLTLGGPSLCLNSGPDSEPGVNGGLGSLLFSPCFLCLFPLVPLGGFSKGVVRRCKRPRDGRAILYSNHCETSIKHFVINLQ